MQYVARRRVVLKSGEVVECLGGAQKVDGYWAKLRSAVGRRSFGAGEAGSRTRERLIKLIRVHQWNYWNLGRNMFEEFAEIVARERPQG